MVLAGRIDFDEKGNSFHVTALRRHSSAQLGSKRLVKPSIKAFLTNLYRMKRDCLSFVDEANQRGDAREADEFREYLQRVESMIEMAGGDPDALGSEQDT